MCIRYPSLCNKRYHKLAASHRKCVGSRSFCASGCGLAGGSSTESLTGLEPRCFLEGPAALSRLCWHRPRFLALSQGRLQASGFRSWLAGDLGDTWGSPQGSSQPGHTFSSLGVSHQSQPLLKKKGVTRKWGSLGGNVVAAYHIHVYEKSREMFMQMTKVRESID